jgi:hypothetical protein
MYRLAKYTLAAALVICVVVPLHAYELVLKNGKIVHFQKYRVDGQELRYVDADGNESSISLSEVDMDRTRDLNSKESPALELPGLSNRKNGDRAVVDPQPSLGEIARKLREKGQVQTPLTSKRTFTNDDIQASFPWSDVGSEDNGDSSRNGGNKSSIDTVRQFFNLDRVTLGRAMLSMARIDVEIHFPERSDWEFSLYDAKQEMVRESLQAEAHPKDVQEQKLAEKRVNDFESIAGRGIQQAREYAKYHPQP